MLPIAKRLMHIDSLQSISNLEKEERARSFFSLDINFSPYLELPRIDDVAVSEHDSVWKEKRNLSMPYTAAVLIRRNYETWKEYLSNPCKGVPAAFRSFAEDKALIYYLAALSSHGIISLDPSKPFLDGECVSGEIYIESERPQGYVEHMLSLWDLLGRPEVEHYDWFERAHEAVFSPLRNGFRVQEFLKDEINLVGGGGKDWGGKYYGLEPHKDTSSLLRYNHKFPEKAYCRVNATSLIYDISHAMVFDSLNIDTLELIHELYPDSLNLITQSIRFYRLLNTFSPFSKLLIRDPLLEELQREMFEVWSEDSMMKYIYHDLVEPALRRKRNVQSTKNHL